MGTEMVPKTENFNHLTWLMAKDFIKDLKYCHILSDPHQQNILRNI
jgi:hypothetical protein